MRLPLVFVLVALLAACSGIEQETPDAVWIRKPFMGLGDPQAAADSACRKYGKTAVYQGTMASPHNVFVPIYAYDCR